MGYPVLATIVISRSKTLSVLEYFGTRNGQPQRRLTIKQYILINRRKQWQNALLHIPFQRMSPKFWLLHRQLISWLTTLNTVSTPQAHIPKSSFHHHQNGFWSKIVPPDLHPLYHPLISPIFCIHPIDLFATKFS